MNTLTKLALATTLLTSSAVQAITPEQDIRCTAMAEIAGLKEHVVADKERMTIFMSASSDPSWTLAYHMGYAEGIITVTAISRDESKAESAFKMYNQLCKGA